MLVEILAETESVGHAMCMDIRAFGAGEEDAGLEGRRDGQRPSAAARAVNQARRAIETLPPELIYSARAASDQLSLKLYLPSTAAP